MSEPRLRLRLQFAALGIAGAALVGLPLSQVLRYQGLEIQALVNERQALDPLTDAVAVQRNLIGHRDVTDRVLQGRTQLEPERRLRQNSVDESLWALHGTLSAGQWLQALAESGALRQDWRTLVHRIGLRQIDRAENQAQHRLLLEQAVQVMDFVSASADLGSYTHLATLQTTRGTEAGPASARLAPGAPQAQRRTLSAQHLASLEPALLARRALLDARIVQLREQRMALFGASAILLALAVASALRVWRARRPLSGPPRDDNRRSRGRRAADQMWQPPEPGRLAEQLRVVTSTPPAQPPTSHPRGS